MSHHVLGKAHVFDFIHCTVCKKKKICNFVSSHPTSHGANLIKNIQNL